MVTNLPFNGVSAFKIRRPLITANGFSADLDPSIKSQLTELDTLLGLRIFTAIDDPNKNGVEAGVKARATTSAVGVGAFSFFLTTELQKPIIAKRTTADRWDNTGILNDLVVNQDKVNPVYLTIGDCIDKTNALAALKYDFQNQNSINYNFLDFNTKVVFDYKNVTDYLVAYSYFVKGITEVNALINFIRSNKDGIANIINYAIVSAAREHIQNEALNIPEYNNGTTNLTYNSDQHPLILKIIAANLSLTSVSFLPSLDKLIDDFIFNGKQLHIIETAGIGDIPEDIKPLLVKYIKNSPIPITPANAKFFLPLFISQIMGTQQPVDSSEVDVAESDKDFDVEFLEDDNSMLQVNTSNVKCAAQLFYCMVLGEELEVFNVVNYFTHKFLIRGGIEIQDQRLREYLQEYVFSNRFSDIKTGKILDRTRGAERQMFYKQVFNYGHTQITEDVIVNKEFYHLWKVLMFESAKYIEKAQESPNPDNYVSRQNVMQAVEDLQYNLSTHCSGMTNVITPIIYEELNFVIKNILMHPEVLRQVVPVGGTWWRVVETLYAAMKSSRPKATVLYNKAKLGQIIIKSIAEYNPATFEDDTNFSGFISNVDAFITTQSIIQESMPHEIRKEREKLESDDDARSNGKSDYKKPEPMAAPAAPAAKAGGDEWDF